MSNFLWPRGPHPAPLSREFSRQEYWSGLPFLSPGDLPDLTQWSNLGFFLFRLSLALKSYSLLIEQQGYNLILKFVEMVFVMYSWIYVLGNISWDKHVSIYEKKKTSKNKAQVIPFSLTETSGRKALYTYLLMHRLCWLILILPLLHLLLAYYPGNQKSINNQKEKGP